MKLKRNWWFKKPESFFRNRRRLSDRLDDFSRPDALSADAYMTHRAVPDRFHALDVRAPDLGVFVVGVGNVVSKAWTFSTNRTLCHGCLHILNLK